MLVHPGVYSTIGLPAWPTWKAVRSSPRRLELKHRALRPVAAGLLEAGAFRPGRVPRQWQRLCGIDRHGAVCT
jgi:hypothetical protein